MSRSAHGGDTTRTVLTLARPTATDDCARSTARSSRAARARGSSSGASGSPREKRAAFRDETYWGRPVPGLRRSRRAGARRSGWRPAAHGGNRTGRVFTGDRSGDWLFGALHRAGFANQPTSVRADDGLELSDAYVAAAVRCAPPENKPTPEERDRCLPFLVRELDAPRACPVIVVLGGFAYEAAGGCSRAAGRALPGRGPDSRTGSRSKWRAADRARLLPPEPAEHLHRPPHRADARRRPGSCRDLAEG